LLDDEEARVEAVDVEVCEGHVADLVLAHRGGNAHLTMQLMAMPQAGALLEKNECNVLCINSASLR
jgi:hypothetical protein